MPLSRCRRVTTRPWSGLGLIGFLAVVSAAHAQPAIDLAADPEAARFIYEDLHNFSRAMALLDARSDSAAVLQAEYFDKGSIGLRTFVERQDFTAQSLLAAIREDPDDYATVGDLPAELAGLDPALRAAFRELQRLHPNAVFPPTYFFVGPWKVGGEASAQGLLISLRTVDRVVPLVTHELVHFQQAMAQGIEEYRSIYGPKKSLLALSIREGSADFLAALVSGSHTHEAAYSYVLEHESKLWARFEREMLGAETGDWMWVTPADADQPRDVGYALGHRIVETRYQNAPDKAKALESILSVTDYSRFLEESGYADRFEPAAYAERSDAAAGMKRSDAAAGTERSGAPASADTTVIMDSGRAEVREWLVVNDGVMGGVSSSEMRRAPDGTAVFEGNLSLENNGGFASVRTLLTDADLSGAKAIVLRVKGDGRQYQLRFRTDDRFDGIAYRALFETSAGEWIVVELPFDGFLPTFRGRTVEGAGPLDPGSIRQLGLLLADEREGPFRLEIDWVKVY